MNGQPLKIGAFGTGNLGDDLMLQAILAMGQPCSVVSYGRPLLAHDVPYIQYQRFISDPVYFISNAVSLDFGGGDLFWSEKNLTDMLVFSQIAKSQGVPVRLKRVGLHGYDVNKMYAKLLLSIADEVSVRDSFSLDYSKLLGRADAVLDADYVFTLLENYPVVPRMSPILKVGINFSDTRMTSSDAGFINHMAGIFSELASRLNEIAEFFYVPFCIHRTYAPENDAKVGNLLWEASGGRIKYVGDIVNTDDLVRTVASMDILLGRRFHMQVLGYALNKHVVPMVEYVGESSKYSAIAYDHGINPIPYSGVSQGYVIDNIESRNRNIASNYIASNVEEAV